MSKLSQNYKAVTEGRIAKSEFVRQARQMYPQHINQFTTFDDSIRILRKRGLLSEEVVYQCLGDKFPLESIERGIDYELEEMGYYNYTINSPCPGDYKKAKQKAIDNLAKDPLYYINKIKVGPKQTPQPSDKLEKVKLNESIQETSIQDTEKFKEAEKVFTTLLAKRPLDEPKKLLQVVRTKVYPKYFPSKTCIKNCNLKVVDRVKGDITRNSVQRAAVQGTGGSTYEDEREMLKEAITKKIVQVLGEAATTNLAQLSDQNASIQNIPSILNSLENIVTEIESFIIKTQAKVQGIFDSIGDIKNEDNLPIGYQFAQPILDAFKKDLEPVLAKVTLDQLNMPVAPEIEPAQLEQPERLEPEIEDKKTVFTPNEDPEKPGQPLQESVKRKYTEK